MDTEDLMEKIVDELVSSARLIKLYHARINRIYPNALSEKENGLFVKLNHDLLDLSHLVSSFDVKKMSVGE